LSAVLEGKVFDADDNPVSGATVMIWTASVKKGYSTYCPSCYADCGKRATTDEKGFFTISNLSRDLRFRLLVIKENYVPKYVEKVDPLEQKVITKIKPRQLPSDTTQIVRGRVLDMSGNPVVNATIAPDMVHFKTKDGKVSGRGGAVEGLDPLAVSNKDGNFEIVYNAPATDMTLMIRAKGLAAARFKNVPTGDQRNELKLSMGTNVKGRLMHEGVPVANAQIGLFSHSRFFGESFDEELIGTQKDGTFSFSNITSGKMWYVYAKMESIVELGATEAVMLTTPRDGESIDIGDLNIVPGHRLSGQVILSDGKQIPKGMKIHVSCDSAWDTQKAELPSDGRFTFNNLPTDNYSIFPSVKGYTLSKSNPNLSWNVEGLINKNVDNFIIVLDPGKLDFTGLSAGKFNNKPLISAEKP
jgi:uncharacterized GH25 family protein